MHLHYRSGIICLIILLYSGIAVITENQAFAQIQSKQQLHSRKYDPDTDALQESLYVQMMEFLHGHQKFDRPTAPTNKYQLLQINQLYYPGAKLNGDTLIIPYPVYKVKEITEIRYFIPAGFFNNPSDRLQPEISVSHISPKSTITINQAYTFSYYRSPRIKKSSLDLIRNAIKHLYVMFFPCAIRQTGHTSAKSATLYYQGYTSHEITLENEHQILLLWEFLRRQGSLYFYPSKIDDLQKKLMVYGLLYIINENYQKNYHFVELTAVLSKKDFPALTELKLLFYPFIRDLVKSE